MRNYFGEYTEFEVTSKGDSGTLLGADNMVGDVYSIVLEMNDGVYKAWLESRFSQRVGYLDASMSRRLGLMAADGMVEKAILSFVAFSDNPGEGRYWGGVAVICYNPAYSDEFERFIAGVAKKIGDDVRPRIDFDAEASDKIIQSKGEWLPAQTISLPEKSKGMAIIKRRRGVTDRLIEQGRAGNKGCYVASWIVLLAVVALIVFGLKSCLGW